MERDKIADTIGDFVEMVDCQEIDILRFALEAYGERNLDFVECVLYGYHKMKGIEIATFDKKLLKLIGANSR